MNKKQLFGSSFILALFILGGIIGITRAASWSQENEDNLSPEIQDQIEAREAAYNDLIAEANQQIVDLNSQVNALQDGSEIVSGKETISAQDAVNFAKESLDEDDYLLDIPQLADYQGQVIFAVNFTSGTVYVDAFTGAIVFSNVPERIDEQQAVTIAAEYLEIGDPSGATVQRVELEGSDFFKVNIGNYVVYIDEYGNITKIQTIQYVPQTSSSSPSYEDDHDDDHDDHDDHDDDHEDDD